MNIHEHLITCLGEEGSEISQAASKCLRFGMDDRNVLDPNGPTNRERLITELNDLLGVVLMLVSSGLLPKDWESDSVKLQKSEKVSKFIAYSQKLGATSGPS